MNIGDVMVHDERKESDYFLIFDNEVTLFYNFFTFWIFSDGILVFRLNKLGIGNIFKSIAIFSTCS